jgi:hypothetical protein
MARSFNGTSDLIAADAAAAGLFPADASPLTLAIWVNGAAASTKTAFNLGRSAAANASIVITSASNVGNRATRIVITDNANANHLDVSGTAAILDGTWHHVCLTLDTSRNVKVYVDGTQDISTSYTSGGTYTMGRVGIGCQRRSTNIQFFPGVLQDAAGWSRTLAAGEAASIGSGLPASHLAPDHYWPLFGADSPEPDIGTVAHVTGTLTGTTAARGARVTTGLVAF